MPSCSSMGTALTRFIRVYASDILVGFIVGWFALGILGPAVAEADAALPSPLAAEHVSNEMRAYLPTAELADPHQTMRVEISAYTSRPEETDDTPFITASGTTVHDGTLATNLFPFGTKVRIPALFGDKIFIVEDRMNARYQNHVDVWMNDLHAARQLGRRHVVIEVL